MPEHHRVEPTRTTLASGVRAVLVTALDQQRARLVVELGREWSTAHASHVCLRDTDDTVDVKWPHAATRARPAGDRVRRRHERIRAVVEIEECGLRTFEQDVLLEVEGVMHETHRVAHVRLQLRRELVEIAA